MGDTIVYSSQQDLYKGERVLDGRLVDPMPTLDLSSSITYGSNNPST